MKVEQLTLALDSNAPTLAQVKLGEVFLHREQPYIKLAPVKTLVRSTLVHEVVTRGDFFVAALVTGSLTVLSHSSPIELVESKLQYTRR